MCSLNGEIKLCILMLKKLQNKNRKLGKGKYLRIEWTNRLQENTRIKSLKASCESTGVQYYVRVRNSLCSDCTIPCVFHIYRWEIYTSDWVYGRKLILRRFMFILLKVL